MRLCQSNSKLLNIGVKGEDTLGRRGRDKRHRRARTVSLFSQFNLRLVLGTAIVAESSGKYDYASTDCVMKSLWQEVQSIRIESGIVIMLECCILKTACVSGL